MIFSLFDNKTETFSPVMNFKTEQEAMYQLANIIAFSKENVLAHCPDNFVLYKVGDFEETLGIITAEPSPIRIANGFELLQHARSIYRDYVNTRDFISGKEEEENVNRNDCTDDSKNTVDCGEGN